MPAAKMNSKLFALVAFFISLVAHAQAPQNTVLLKKDDYFKSNNKSLGTGQKVKLISSQKLEKSPTLYQGNSVFSGSVNFEHQGATLAADTVVVYDKENFIRAKGNVVLVTSEGTRLSSQEMEYDGNTKKAIARKNVNMTDPKQSLRTETLYFDRNTQQAYFVDGGYINDGKNDVYSKRGTYFINEQRYDLGGKYNIDNAQYKVEGDDVNYLSGSDTALFNGPTKIINKQNPSNYVYTEQGRYLMKSKEAYLKKNSKIFYNKKILSGNEMYYNQNTGYGNAKGNVKLDDPKEKRYIKGGYGEIFEKKDSAMITQKAHLVKAFEKDSLYFSADKILAYQKKDKSKPGFKESFIRAYHKARFYKTNLQGRGDSLAYNETAGHLELIKNPTMWAGIKQMTGDHLKAFFNPKNQELDSLHMLGNAFAISKADSLNLKDEFNQIKGKNMFAYFKKGDISLVKVVGNAQALSYVDDADAKTKKPIRVGVSLSTCGEISADFTERKMQILLCNIGAITDIYPMFKINKDQRFLPNFNWNTKDRLHRWEHIFLDTPNNPEIVYESDDKAFLEAEKLKQKQQDLLKKDTDPKRKSIINPEKKEAKTDVK
jgi:lipopolysaccharide export system protein LptA